MPTAKPPVAVLGLGAMGSSLARAFLAAGHPTTVWNRTRARADALVDAGAVAAASPQDGVAGADLVVVCLLDATVALQVLDAAGDAIAGKDVVNVSTSTPADARSLASRVDGAGARYLDGAIMVPTPLIGTPDTLVLYSGDGRVFDGHADTLRALGGDHEMLGDDPGLAGLHELGMAEIFFNGMTAFLHAAALLGTDGVSAQAFLPYAERIVDVLRSTLAGLADDVDRGQYPGDEDNLAMDLAGLAHVADVSAAAGIDTSVPELPLSLVRKAIAAGHASDGFARVFDLLRRPTP